MKGRTHGHRTQHKWDEASRTFDLFSFADDRRLGPGKRKLFERIRGRTLLVAAGTGNDVKFHLDSIG